MKTLKLLPILISLFFLNFNGNSQTFFQKTYAGIEYDRGNSVQQTLDGGYIVVGVEYSFGAGGRDVFLIKTDATGDTLWTRSFGGTGDDYGMSVKQTTDKGYIVVGYTNSFGQGLDDVYLIKTDSLGNLLWSKTYGGINFDFGSSVQQTSEGGYIVVGATASFGSGNYDVYLIKTNSTGDTLWTKTLGGSALDEGISAQQTNDGGYIIAGTTLSFSVGNYSAYLNKIDANGNVLWAKTYSTSGSEEVHQMQLTDDGGYIIAGGIFIGPTITLSSIFKTNSSGDFLWAKNYSNGGSNSVQETTDKGYILTGSEGNLAFLIRTDSVGDTIWTKSFQGLNNYANGSFVQQTTDNGFIVAGSTHKFGAGDPVYLIKTDSNGNSCIQNYFSTTITTPVYTVNNAVSLTSHGGITGNPATINNFGGDIFDICSHVGIEPNIKSKNALMIYPDPFSSETTLETDKVLTNAFLMVYTMQGQLVKKIKNINGHTVTLHRDNLATGIYYVQLIQDNDTYDTERFIITDE